MTGPTLPPSPADGAPGSPTQQVWLREGAACPLTPCTFSHTRHAHPRSRFEMTAQGRALLAEHDARFGGLA